MALLPRDMETLIDLVENKLSDMPIWDGDDRKTAVTLERCLVELKAMKDATRAAMPSPRRRCGAFTSAPAARVSS